MIYITVYQLFLCFLVFHYQNYQYPHHKCTFCNEFSHDESECPNKKCNNMVVSGSTFAVSKRRIYGRT
jgi:hypothetical protein